MTFNLALCALAVVTCAACAILLLRAYRRTRRRLIFWCAISFGFLTLNNVALFLDLVVIAQDLRVWRHVAALAAIAFMIAGLRPERD